MQSQDAQASDPSLNDAGMSSQSLPATTPQSSESSTALKKPRVSDKKRIAIMAKQEKRKFRGADAPDPSLGVTLDEFTEFTEFLKFSKRILGLFGAGLSASSGVATFRGPDCLWRGTDPADLSNSDAFFEDPALVWWMFSHRMMKSQIAKPNPGHFALAKLAEVHPGFFAINQNIDGLCERASFPMSQLVQYHGSLFSIKCSMYASEKDKCDYVNDAIYPINEALTIPPDTNIADPNVPLPDVAREDLPHCPKCNNLLRPNVVFFGDSYPQTTTERVHNFTSGGPIDLMLVVGTSAQVMSSAMYIAVARNAGARVAYFNIEECHEGPARVWAGDWMFEGDAAVMLPEMLKGVIGSVGGGSGFQKSGLQ